ncbi:MAG: Flagellar protein FlhE [Syntrophorhabdus sp. PtaB.Bin184]|nr:MAG: Flagellar protein FlhE [Syntrophorhabdus sp. PtaB.Bin184]
MKTIRTLCFVVAVLSFMSLAVPGLASSESGTATIPLDQLKMIPMDRARAQSIELPASLVQRAGAWSDVEVGPTLYQRNWWYKTTFSRGSIYVPPGSLISQVAWQWGVTNRYDGLLVWLGYVSGGNFYYIDISSWGSGTSTAFNTLPADMDFEIWFGYTGTGMLNPPTYGQSDTVIVSWYP